MARHHACCSRRSISSVAQGRSAYAVWGPRPSNQAAGGGAPRSAVGVSTDVSMCVAVASADKSTNPPNRRARPGLCSSACTLAEGENRASFHSIATPSTSSTDSGASHAAPSPSSFSPPSPLVWCAAGMDTSTATQLGCRAGTARPAAMRTSMLAAPRRPARSHCVRGARSSNGSAITLPSGTSGACATYATTTGVPAAPGSTTRDWAGSVGVPPPPPSPLPMCTVDSSVRFTARGCAPANSGCAQCGKVYPHCR